MLRQLTQPTLLAMIEAVAKYSIPACSMVHAATGDKEAFIATLIFSSKNLKRFCVPITDFIKTISDKTEEPPDFDFKTNESFTRLAEFMKSNNLPFVWIPLDEIPLNDKSVLIAFHGNDICPTVAEFLTKIGIPTSLDKLPNTPTLKGLTEEEKGKKSR